LAGVTRCTTTKRVPGQHYGFTEEELDFIINYEINYRMGKDSDE
jgi:hypothetical protein